MKRMLIFCGIASLMLGMIKEGFGRKPVQGSKLFELQRIKVNEVDMPIQNIGAFGQNKAGSAGCIWPKGTGQPYIFGAGIWVGAFMEDSMGDTFYFKRTEDYGVLPDTLVGNVLVSVTYNTVGRGCDFIPGPPDSQTIWDQYAAPTSHDEVRILFSDSTEKGDHEVPDTALWPYRDCEGNPIFISHLDTWCEYTDLCDSLHAWQTGTYPLGIHIQQSTLAWNTEKTKNMVFFFYYIKNVSDDTLKYVFVGHAADDDVGGADDDLLGLDKERSLGWTMTLGYEPGWTATQPYYVGKKFFQGPPADDTVPVFGLDVSTGPDTIIYPGERLPITSFNRCTRHYDATNELKRYQMLAGYNIASGKFDPFGSAEDVVPEDKRMVMGCGPFKMDPGEVDTFMLGVIFSNGDVGELEYLRDQADVAQLMYDNRIMVCDTSADTIIRWYTWPVLGAPLPPKVTAIPGDGKVTIVWDNSSEVKADEWYGVMQSAGDTLYREYDFEGYRLWKSRTGVTGEWEVIGQWDIENDITLLPGDIYTPGYGNMSGEESKNEGLAYSYVDEDVINGISYYYAVTPYDFNTPGETKRPNLNVWVSLECGYFPITCTPRAEPENFVPPTVTPEQSRGGATTVKLTPLIETPIGITGDTYILKWEETKPTEIEEAKEVTPTYSYRIYNQTKSEYVPSTPRAIELPLSEERFITPEGDLMFIWTNKFLTPVFDGIRLQGEITLDLTYRDTIIPTSDTTADTIDMTKFRLPDSICVTTGVYADSAGLKIDKFFIPNPKTDSFYTTLECKKWAWHGGANIEITWHKVGDTLKPELWDVTNDIEIPFDTTVNQGWLFWGYPALYPWNKPRPYLVRDKKPARMYVCGVQILLNGGSRMNTEGFDSIKDGDVWTIYSSCDNVVPCKGNEFTINTTKFSYSTVHQLDKIRVVPNPYLVRAMWDKSKDYGWVHFVNLPSDCVIRIYTLAGDLIRTIQHHHTSEGGREGNLGGMEKWDMLTKNNQMLTSGLYLYHVSIPDGASKVGKFAIIK